MQIGTGSKTIDGYLFAQIAITLISSSLDGKADDGRDHSSGNYGCTDFEMDRVSEILNRYGGGVSVDQNSEKLSRLAIMLKFACD